MFRTGSTLLACLSGACASTSTSPPVQPFDTTPLAWQRCVAPVTGNEAECAWLEVPRRWSDPLGEKLVVGVRRIRAPGDSRGQLWALDGGPGFAGDVYFQSEFQQVAAAASLDLIVPAHRGVVGTTISCPGVDISQPDSWSACAQVLTERWGRGADGFDSTEAAEDVAHLMDRVPTSGVRLAFAGSYGSVWGQRLLQRRPEGLDGMWLDSIVDLDGTLERADTHADEAMRTLMERCTGMPACAAMFNGEPLARAEAVIRQYPTGAGCGQTQGLTQEKLQALMYAWLSGPPAYWVLAAAGYARADRCGPDDVRAFEHAVERLGEVTPDGAGFAYNPVLNRQVLFRELYRFEADLEELMAAQASLLATRRGDIAVARQASAFGASWRKAGTSTVPRSGTQLVLLNGALDPLDPVAWAVRTARRWPQAERISVEWAGHSVLRYLGTEPGQCGARLLAAFLARDRLPVECVAEVPGPDFSGASPSTQAAAQDWFGDSVF